jgi:hypothetical protein
MIITLKITLIRALYYKNEWSANIEIDESSTLEDLHYAIQDAVDFDNDHLYCFFISRTDRSRSRTMFDDEDGRALPKKLKEMFPLPPDRCLFYLFDWGDEWVFKISPSRKRPHEPAKGTKYPRVQNQTGEKLVQYPQLEDDFFAL